MEDWVVPNARAELDPNREGVVALKAEILGDDPKNSASKRF